MVLHQPGNVVTEVLARLGRLNPVLDPLNEVIGFLWASVSDPAQIYLHYQAAILSGKFPRSMLQNPGFVLRAEMSELQLLLVLLDRGLYYSFLEAWKKAVRNSFIWTRDGCIGTSLAGTREGGVVALIPGVRTPMVLRISKMGVRDRYKVVGPAFINGMMEGERGTKAGYLGSDLQAISLE